MRVLYVRVPEGCRDAAAGALSELEIEFAVLGTAFPDPVSEEVTPVTEPDDEAILLQIPIPADAVGPVLEALEDAGVDVERYTVVTSGETAMTSTWDALMSRYARDFDPLPMTELRSKAMNLSQDPGSYYVLMVLSALIATTGLLADSPAIVVGSMVIAPVVGPVLTASVGGILGDRRMVLDSVRMQALGLVVAVLAATGLGFVLQTFRLVPPVLDVGSIELIGVRLAPNALALIVGLASGAAGGIGLTTKGPMSLIGVMIAAALIPTAAATGVGFVWNEPLVGIGTLALLLVTVVAINLASFGVLWTLYRPNLTGDGALLDFRSVREAALVFGALVVLAIVVVATVGATAGQIAFERTANDVAHEVIEESGHEDLTVVAVRSEYDDPSPFTGPRTVTVSVSDTDPVTAPPDDLASEIADETASRTDRSVTVRLRFVEYQETTTSTHARSDPLEDRSVDSGWMTVRSATMFGGDPLATGN